MEWHEEEGGIVQIGRDIWGIIERIIGEGATTAGTEMRHKRKMAKAATDVPSLLELLRLLTELKQKAG